MHGIWIPRGLVSCKVLSPGAKLLYGRLCLYAGKSGECRAGRDTIAEDMGLSVATVGRHLEELVDYRLVKRIRKGPNAPAVCVFLWHPILAGSLKSADSSIMSDQWPDSAEVSHHPTPLIAQKRALDGANVSRPDGAELSRPYKEEKNQYEKNHRKESSSFEESPQVETEHRGSGAVSTTTSHSVEVIRTEPDGQPLNPEVITACKRWEPTGEQLKAIAGFMGEHFNSLRPVEARKSPPDRGIVKTLAAAFGSWDDFAAWAENLPTRIDSSEIRGYGFYPTDATTVWPDIREHEAKQKWAREILLEREADEKRRVEAVAATQRAVVDRCRELGWKKLDRFSDCLVCAGFGRNPETAEFCTCLAGELAAKCYKCQNDGIVYRNGTGTEPPGCTWCDCHHAAALMAREGAGYLDRVRAEEAERQRQLEQQIRQGKEFARLRDSRRSWPFDFHEFQYEFFGSKDLEKREAMLEQMRLAAEEGVKRAEPVNVVAMPGHKRVTPDDFKPFLEARHKEKHEATGT